MKLPSVHHLFRGVVRIFRQYPLEMCFALAGTIGATAAVELEGVQPEAANWCYRVMMAANLGLVLTLSASLLTRSRELPAAVSMRWKIAAAMLACAFAILLNPMERPSDVMRFVLLSLAGHLLVAFSGFLRAGHLQGFWQFNKALFIRVSTGLLYTGVLYGGLAASIASVNFLFGVKFEWDTYSILWIWLAGIFNTLFFLAGVPRDFKALDDDQSYPAALKVFTQYVLVPLMSVYLLILLAYEVKIVLEWSLPKGNVSLLVMGYSVFGILAILLIFPIRDSERARWPRVFGRSFYVLLLPLLVLLLVAIGARISRYGVTEPRYFLVVLAFWLAGVSVYALFSPTKIIKWIPVTLCLLAVLAAYGPQSAISMSLNSQQQRMRKLLGERPSELRDDNIRSVVRYLLVNHGTSAMQPFIKKDLGRMSAYFYEKARRNRQYGAFASREMLQDSVLALLPVRNWPSDDADRGEDWMNSARELVVPQPATLVAFSSPTLSGESRQLFQVDGQAGSFVVLEGDRLELMLGADSVHYALVPMLRALRRHQPAFLRDTQRHVLLVPDPLLRDTVQLGTRHVIIRFETISSGGSSQGRPSAESTLYSGSLLFLNRTGSRKDPGKQN